MTLKSPNFLHTGKTTKNKFTEIEAKNNLFSQIRTSTVLGIKMEKRREHVNFRESKFRVYF